MVKRQDDYGRKQWPTLVATYLSRRDTRRLDAVVARAGYGTRAGWLRALVLRAIRPAVNHHTKGTKP